MLQIELQDYANDPFFRDFLGVLNEDAVEYHHQCMLTKHISQKHGSVFEDRVMAYLSNNVVVLHRLFRNRNALRIFLAFRRSSNCYSLARRLRVSRATVRHWVRKMLLIGLLKPYSFHYGNECLYRRNVDDPMDMGLVFKLLDAVAESLIKRMAVEEARKRLEMDGLF
ncbi:MAG: hypothetical protein ABIB71_04050 [Candidatus Woesearchaeota archaeon]